MQDKSMVAFMSSSIRVVVSIQQRLATDRQTDRQTYRQTQGHS